MKPSPPANASPEEVDRALRTLYVMAGALFAGLLLFAVFVILFPPPREPGRPASENRILHYLSVGLSGVTLITSFLVRAQLLTREARPADPLQRIHRYRVSVLVALALNEGAVLFALVVVYLDGTAFPGLWPALASALAMYFHLPTRHALEHFLSLK